MFLHFMSIIQQKLRSLWVRETDFYVLTTSLLRKQIQKNIFKRGHDDKISGNNNSLFKCDVSTAKWPITDTV
jgi:hypothetical protein